MMFELAFESSCQGPDEFHRGGKGRPPKIDGSSELRVYAGSGIAQAAMSPEACGGRTVEPIPRRTSDAPRDLFDGRLT